MTNKRDTVAYGAGNALLGLIENDPTLFDWVVDDTPGYAGQEIAGLPIYPFEKALAMKGNVKLVVCAQTSTAAVAIARKLAASGFAEGADFIDCSEIQIERMSRRMNDVLGLGDHPNLRQSVALSVKSLPLRNLSGIAGTWLFCALVDALDNHSGQIAECGVYQGANAIAALECCPSLRGKHYCLFDSFEGLKNCGTHDPASRQNEFSDTSLSRLRSSLAIYPACSIHEGYFEQTLPSLADASWDLVYIDCDLSAPAKFCAEYFWPRMPRGALMLVHDYWYPTVTAPQGFPEPFRGMRLAVDEFLQGKTFSSVVFPETSHMLIRKD